MAIPPTTSSPTPRPAEQPIQAADPNVPPPARMAFEEHELPDEPPTDRRLVFENGRETRERMRQVDARAENTMTAGAAPTTFTLAISHALLDDAAHVVMEDEQPVLAPVHEEVWTLESLGRLETEEALEEAVTAAREIAAAQADMVFRGRELAQQVLGRAKGERP